MPEPSLDRSLLWDQLLAQLGVRVDPPTLPALVVCPECRQLSLRIWHDAVTGGQWRSCGGCRTHGPMIEFAAATWKIDLAAAATKASLSGCLPRPLPERGLTALLTAQAQRQRTADWLQKARENCRESQLPGVILEALDCRDLREQAADELYVGRGRDLTALMQGESRDIRDAQDAVRDRIWQKLLALPFYDMPGRVCGLLCVTEQGLYGPQAFRLCPPRGTSVEAGAAFLEALYAAPTRQLGDAKFVIDDPWLGLKLRLLWTRSEGVPPPVAVCRPVGRLRTTHVWELFPTQELIFWGRELTPAIIRQAVLADGLVARLDAGRAELDVTMRAHGPAGWLRSLQDAAVPWAVALRDWLQRADDLQFEAVLLEVDMPPDIWRQFLDESPIELGKRLRRSVGRHYHRRLASSCGNVVQHHGAWYVGNKLICDAAIRLNELVRTPTGDEYHCRAGLPGLRCGVDFVVTQDEIDRLGLLRVAQDKIREQALRLITYDPRYNRDALAIAAGFHKPVATERLTLLGWDEGQRRLAFPRFVLYQGGRVQTIAACYLSKGAPGGNLRQPDGVLSPEIVKLLSQRHDEASLFWATFVCVAANLVAPALRRDPCGTILDGVGADLIARGVCRAFGCRSIPWWMARQQQLADEPLLWPTYVPASPRKAEEVRRFGAWVAEPDARQALISGLETKATWLGMNAPWNVIRCRRKLGTMSLLPAAVGTVLPEYLHDLLKRNFNLAWQEGLRTTLLHDAASWFAETHGGDGGAVTAALRFLQPAEKAPAWRFLLQLLHDAKKYQTFGVVQAKYDDPGRKGPALVLHEDSATVFIAQSLPEKLLPQALPSPPNLLRITQSLQEAGALLDEPTYRGERGWSVKRDWWEAQQRRCVEESKSSGEFS